MEKTLEDLQFEKRRQILAVMNCCDPKSPTGKQKTVKYDQTRP